VKVTSEWTALRLLGCDLQLSAAKLEHVCADAAAEKVAALRARHGADLLVINFQCPQKQGALSVLLWWMVSPTGAADPNFSALWQRFCDGDDKWRTERLKLIPTVVEGNFVVRKVVGSKPAILGKSLKARYHRGEGYIEADFDIASSGTAANMWKVVEGVAKTLVIDLGFVIEAQEANLLPERLMATVRFQRIDLTKAVR